MLVRLFITFRFLVFVHGFTPVTKTWICNTNADDKANWVGGDYMNNCTGFHFPENFGNICLMSLGRLTTNAIYLPQQGDIELRNHAEIIFSESSDTCVRVRDDLETKDYYDPQCWKNDNEAVPDLERSPCSSDNVVFPKDATYSITNAMKLYPSNVVYMFRNTIFNWYTWNNFLDTPEDCNEIMVHSNQRVHSFTPVTKTWICNTNADDKANWVGGDYMNNCTGFHFPENFGNICLMSLGRLTTNAIYLPQQGDIELRNHAEIIFSESSDTCVRVRDDLETKDYYDPQCWKNDNEAVPDLERSPCSSDNVVFPKDATYSITNAMKLYPSNVVYMFRNTIFNWYTWNNFLDTPEDCNEIMVHSNQRVHSSVNLFTNFFGLSPLCRFYLHRPICDMKRTWRKIVCSSPIVMQGHCTLFCGSVITITVESDFDIKLFFKKFVDNKNVDAYYSMIESDTLHSTYQLTMTDDGEYTGDSILHAKQVYDKIKADIKPWKIVFIEGRFSGPPLAPERAVANAIRILFGTFFAVIFLFVLMFLFYVGPLQNVKILPRRFAFMQPTKKAGKPFVFARFENRDDGTMSMGGSIVSLDKAFDNPMYGQQMPSTSAGFGMEPVVEAEEMKETHPKIISESQFRNPIYEDDKIDVEEIDEE